MTTRRSSGVNNWQFSFDTRAFLEAHFSAEVLRTSNSARKAVKAFHDIMKDGNFDLICIFFYWGWLRRGSFLEAFTEPIKPIRVKEWMIDSLSVGSRTTRRHVFPSNFISIYNIYLCLFVIIFNDQFIKKLCLSWQLLALTIWHFSYTPLRKDEYLIQRDPNLQNISLNLIYP